MTRAQLLPLPPAELRRIQLKHHVALAALRGGQADVAQLATLMNAIYLTYFLDRTDPAPPRRAEAAVNQCVARAERGEPWAVTDLERAAIEQLQRASTADPIMSPIPAG
ncbi:hypothetical protein ACN8ZM_40230 (plasmid) [Burkholderia aenigmatica]|uniref:hypothetical protein n=1 Tax=Burkholderia aenigmatica TaxID=2015348 RepID=UPI003B435BD2